MPKSASKFTGCDAARRDLAKIRKGAPTEFGTALVTELEIEAVEVKRRTPVKTGSLRSTIRVVGPVQQGKKITATIEAGDVAVDYALPVHEDLEAVHPVGEAKFIEGPLKESAPFMPARIAKRIDLNNAK
jgi:hypothetical protein